MGRHRVPEDHPPLGPELVQHPVHDRPRRLAPAPCGAGRPVGLAPAGQIALGRERDPRPAHALVAGRLTERDDVGARPLGQVRAQVGEPQPGGAGDVVRAGLGILVERRPDADAGEVGEQVVHARNATGGRPDPSAPAGMVFPAPRAVPRPESHL